MKYFLKYITITIAVFISISCIKEEMNSSDIANSDYVEFIARPTSMTCHDVASGQTKAFAEDLTDIEKRIENAFFLLFAPDGSLVDEYDKLNVENNVIPTPEKKKLEVSNSNLTACFIANVPESFVEDIDHVDDLTNVPLQLTYAPRSETGYIGIPMMDVKNTPTKPGDDVKCFPMIGIYSGKLTKDNTTIQIPLKRLFAKVQVDLSMDMYENGLDPILKALGLPTGGLSNTYFNLKELTVTNLPRKVILAPLEDSNQESPWATTDTEDNVDDFFLSPQTVEVMQEVWDIRSVEAGVNTSFSFTCYVPEYSLIPTESNNNQANKAALYNKDTQHPAHISLSGLFRRYDNTNAEVTYNIFLGENNSDSFSLFRNNFYKNNVVLDGSGHLNFGADNRVQKHPLNLVEVYGESSNCYIITVDGDYVIDTYAGAFSNIAANTPKVTGTPEAWSDGNNTVSCKLDEEDPTKIIVSISPKSGASAIAEGNAVISIPGGWSWHLWIVPASDNDQLFNVFLGTLEEQTYQVTNAVVLNRNLGASGPTAAGAYYKWGDNKPYFDGAYRGAGTASSYTWADGDADATNDVKHTTDPCPPGYKVPSKPIWIPYTQWLGTTASNAGGILELFGSGSFVYDINPSIRYPYTSYVFSNNTLNGNKTDYIPFQNGYTFTGMGRSGTIPIKLSILGTYDFPRLAEDKFTITKMKVLVSNNEGRLWYSSSGEPGYFYYTHKELDLGNLSEETFDDVLVIVEYKHERRYATGYGIDLSLSKLRELIKQLTSGRITDAFLLSVVTGWSDYEEIKPSMSDNDKTVLLGELLTIAREGVNFTEFDMITESIEQSEGYQVRCVRDE